MKKPQMLFLNNKSQSPKIIIKNICIFFIFFLVIGLSHYEFKKLPIWGDSLGYMIVNSNYMYINHTIFQPIEHDTGHPPLTFLIMALFQALFGEKVFVFHLTQWLWGALLLWGMWVLPKKFSNNSVIISTGAVLITLFHPHIYSLLNSLVPDIALTVCLVWLFVGFYYKNPLIYIFYSALFTFTKLSALPILCFFYFVELFIYPSFLLFINFNKKRKKRIILKWWLKWIYYSCLSLIPISLWLIIHRIHSGFWFQSSCFDITTKFEFTKERFLSGFWDYGKWGIWSRDGNNELAFLSLGLFIIFVFIILACYLKNLFKNKNNRITNQSLFKNNKILWLSFSLFLQGSLSYVLYSFKVQIVYRYYVFMNIMLIIGSILLLTLLELYLFKILNLMIRNKRIVSLLTKCFISFIMILIVFNYAVRLHPNYPDKIPFVSDNFKKYFRSYKTLEWEMNLEGVDSMYVAKKAIKWFEKEIKNEKDNVIIIANYPHAGFLRYPQAGYLKGAPFNNIVSYYHEDKFINNDWDYYLTSSIEKYTNNQFPTEKIIKMKKVVLIKTFKDTNNTWDYEFKIYKCVKD